MRSIEIQSGNCNIKGLLYEPKISISPLKRVLIIGSALGVPKEFYQSFSNYMSSHGFAVLTFDYAGVGHSICKDDSVNLETWANNIDELINFAKSGIGGDEVYFLAHSVSGHLLGITKRATELAGILLVASQLGTWREWPFPQNIKYRIFWRVLVPLMTFKRAVFPAKKMGMARFDIPAGVMRQASRWHGGRRYMISDSSVAERISFKSLVTPIFSICFSDDQLAPKNTCINLMEEFGSTEKEFISYQCLSTDVIGHFGFFTKSKGQNLWPYITKWLGNK
jgi:predicted alpha/beta hydrolase